MSMRLMKAAVVLMSSLLISGPVLGQCTNPRPPQCRLATPNEIIADITNGLPIQVVRCTTICG